ncbi:bifunctional riboflavin kinase/FAD synthetase [Rothia amarae]|uniref:Riboflavin biosynthesis protein n=1 Tax=Rothia amarae TaxID=169480 RepID=A0A7H2BI46_9MICC|nr:bifunctional riboflavin kinase/FAD synthetase [Rothia amarae]QNV39342.1 bifunctional riboflavin kinase/FAD synthetase [Rothia amarae]
MDLYRTISSIPADFGPSVVTIGNFDGIHTGHAAVLGTVVNLAREQGLTPTAVSFDPHPAVVHRPNEPLHEIMGQPERQQYLAELGIDAYILLHYTLEFSRQSPEEFVKNTFVDALHARYVVIGEDVRFGHNNAGDLQTMRQLGQTFGFEVVTIDELMADETHRTSSTRIRQLLAEGKVEEARQLLGRPHRMVGEIVHGAARGRELGFPTANLSQQSRGFIPADGVYAGWLIDEHGKRHPVATSIGTNPTFEGITQRQVEAHVINRPDEPIENFNLYGQEVTVEFLHYLRPTVAYTGAEALIEQIAQDVLDTEEKLAEN